MFANNNPSEELISHQPEHSGAPAPRTAQQRRKAGRRVWLLLGVLGVGAAAAATTSTLPRLAVQKDLHDISRKIDEARRNVTVVSPTPGKSQAEIRLPGSTSALQQTVVYARTSGYIAGLSADIGDRVKAGQLLATIASPEVDQQLIEALARLEEARANRELAETRLERIRGLLKKNAASQQELDDLQAVYNTQVAAERVSAAVVSRLQTDQSYQKVVAPFGGVITQRNVDIGSLITAGSGSNVTSLFELQQQTTMKVFIDVPQNWASSIAAGTAAMVELREFPGETFEGKVVRTSGALDPSTRTLRTEVHLPNSNGRLLPGMYAQVKLSPDNANRPLVIPASTLVIDGAGVQVMSVEEDNRLARRPIRLGRDFGREVEVVSGLTRDMRLVVSPREDLRPGEKVTVVNPASVAVVGR